MMVRTGLRITWQCVAVLLVAGPQVEVPCVECTRGERVTSCVGVVHITWPPSIQVVSPNNSGNLNVFFHT